MVQFFSERFVAILVVLSRDAIAASVEKTHDVLLESDNIILSAQNPHSSGHVLLIAFLVGVLLISIWYINKLRRIVKKRRAEVEDVLNQITDGFIKLDTEFRYVSVNRKAGEMIRHQPSSLIGKKIWDVFPDMVSTPTHNAIIDSMRSRQPTRAMDYYPPFDLWYENNIYPTENGLTIFLRDMTDHMRAEQKLLESGRMYKAIASTIPGSLITVVDKDYRYVLFEGDLFAKLGYSKASMFQKKARDVISKERYEEILPFFERAFAGETFRVELRRGDLDLLTHYAPLRDEHHEVYSIMVLSIDVTPLKNAERYLEKKVMDRTAELEAVNKDLESFTYSVAHDLRSPLRAVEGYTNMLSEDYSDKLDDEARRLMTLIRSNALRMTTLIDELLAFSRLGRKEVRKAAVDMKRLFDHTIEQIDTRNAIICIGELYPAFGDMSLLQNVVVNLLSNAVKYTSKKSNPRIIISSERDGDRITYSITDNGVGFDMKYAQNLFGVFQRLHSLVEFEGTGVGLAIVQKIITRHGGKVWADARINEGATFYFTLPEIPAENI